MTRWIWLVLFAMTAGFTASGIVASLYRMLVSETETTAARVLRSVVMVIAGPTLIFESAVRGFVSKEWSPFLFWLVAAGLAYWSLAIGLFILEVSILAMSD